MISFAFNNMNPYIFSVLCGLAVHMGIFIRGEWHLNAPKVLVIHVLLPMLLWILLPTTTHQSRLGLAHVMLTLGTYISYLTGLLSSIVIYRLYFHPLRHFQGPKLAAVSKLWHVWNTLDSRNFRVLEAMHDQYGQFVRTGPNEVTTFHPMAIEWLDNPKNETSKPDWYDVLFPRTSTIFTRSEHEHTIRRRLWNHALSIKSIHSYTPRITRHVEALATYVGERVSQPLCINDVMAFFAFDSMGDFLFNNDFGMLRSSQWHPAIVQQREALALLAPLNDAIWLVRVGFAFAPFYGRIREWFNMIRFCDQQMQTRMKTEVEENDIAQFFIDEYHSLAGERTQKERQNLLSGNTISAIVAGSDTTSPALTCTWYLLTKHPEHAQRIHDEVKAVDIADPNALAALPHLNAVISESLRLFPPAMTANARVAPPQGLWIEDTYIPGGTKIGAPKYVIMRLDEAFERPGEFIPERWYSQPELVRCRAAFAPFGIGHRQCVGKNLALVQLRLVLAMLTCRYTSAFAPGFDVNSVERDMKDQVTCHPGRCSVVLSRR